MRGGWTDQAPVQRQEFHYGSREFLAASDLARRLPYSPRVSDLIGSLVRNPALIRVLVAIWRRTERLVRDAGQTLFAALLGAGEVAGRERASALLIDPGLRRATATLAWSRSRPPTSA